MRKAIILPAIFLAACSSYPASLPSIKPYKMDIQQGNVVTPKMMMQLRPGMTKAQVRFVMGTPLIADSFHANRWDYFYRMQKGGKVIEQRRIILDFEDDKLLHVRGDVIPAGSSGDAQAGEHPASREPITLKPANGSAPKKEEKGMLDKLKFWKSDDEKAPAKTEAKPSAEEDKLQVLPPLMETPATEPSAAPKPVAKPEAVPVPKQEEKGLLDKLKFWKSDEPEQASKPTPAERPAAPSLPAIPDANPETLPPLMDTPSAEPAPTKPATKPAPTTEAKPQPKAEPAPAVKPAPKPVPSAEPKPVPKPQDNLPAEEDPSYFDRMLEKIGF
jgi:outer membrane protein assembly factor BamE